MAWGEARLPPPHHMQDPARNGRAGVTRRVSAMSDTTTDVRDQVIVDYGPVRDAALILVETSTLAEHVHVFGDDGGYTTQIEHLPDGVPYALWGSGTQALWRLLCAVAYVGEQVSLYEVVSRLDSRNRSAVAAALAALCGAS